MDVSDLIDIDEDMPLELLENARLATMEMLPDKSKQIYKKIYQNFKDWQNGHGVQKITQNLILSFFQEMETKKKWKPPSMWAYYSMLKATLRSYEDVDIGAYLQVKAFLKKKSAGYKPVRATVFKENEIHKFIMEADDKYWLDVKVVCIFGICGACRTNEFVRITTVDVERHGDLFLVRLVQTKTKITRSFTISGTFFGIVQRYMDLRRENFDGRFFVNFQKGKCTSQFIGKNKFSGMPRKMAEYLQLENPARYTGHSFRRTSTTILANSGADIETIMRHGGWKNASCAKIYIEDSLNYKKRTGDMITSSIFGQTSSTVNDGTSLPVAQSSSSVNCDDSSSIIEQTLARSPARTPSSMDTFLDFDISVDELVRVVDQASQNCTQQQLQERAGTGNETVGERATGENATGRVLTQINNNSNATGRVLTQINNNSMLNAMKPGSSIAFHKIENCTFNFYVKP